MSIHPPDSKITQALPGLGGSVAALVQEITRLKIDLEALRITLQATPEAQQLRGLGPLLRDVVQWVGIALEVEETYEKHIQGPKQDTPSAGALDLDAARASIGGKLDRLRAAAGSECFSEQPD